MKEINKFINAANFDKSVKNTGLKSVDIEKQLEKFKQKFISRLEKEVPQNGIFTNVSEEINDKKFTCEYSPEQTSDKKDKRVLKLSSQSVKSDKDKPTVLFEGTKEELVKFVREQNFANLINSKPQESNDNAFFYNPAYSIINRTNQKQISFGSNIEQNNTERQNAFNELKKKFQDVVDNPYCNDEVKEEFSKRLSVLATLEKSDLSYERIKDIFDLFLENSCNADEALKIALLNDDGYNTFKQLPDILGVTLPYSDSADIASLNNDKFDKFIKLYNLKADENAFKDTLTQTYESKVPIYSYYDYSKKFAQSLIPVFKAEDSVYKQSVELIENGVEPICLKNLTKVVLNDTQKQRVKFLNDEKIVPSEDLIKTKDERVFDLSVSFYKKVDKADIDSAVLKAKEYSLNYKTFDRFIETFMNAAKSNKFVINKNKQYDGTVSYEAKLLDMVELISQYEDSDYIRANDLIKRGIPLNYIDDIINLDLKDSQFERALDLLNKKVPNACLIASDDNLYNNYNEKSKKYDRYSASKIVVNDYQQKLYEKLSKKGYNSMDADTLSKLYGKKLNRGLEILKRVYSIFSIDDVTDNKSYKQAMELLSKGYNDGSVYSLAVLNDTDYDKSKIFIDNNVGSYIIQEVLELDDDKYNKVIDLYNKGVPPHLLKQVADFPEDKYKKYISCLSNENTKLFAYELSKLSDALYDRALYLMNKGMNMYQTEQLLHYNNQIFEKILYLLNNGYNLSDSVNIAIFDNRFEEENKKINSDSNEMRKLFFGEDYLSKLKKNSQGKYQQEVLNLLSPENVTFNMKSSLIHSNLSEKDFFASVQKFSKSTFKLAYDTPNQYLSGIDTIYTEKINGKYPELPEKVKTIQQNQIKNFFKLHMGEILKTLNYLDTDTVNQMMDKRTEKFEQTLEDLNLLTDDNFQLLSDLIKCRSKETGKLLTANEKIQLSQICLIFQKSGLDFSKLKEMVINNQVDLNQAKKVITEKILQNAGMTDEEVQQLSQNDLKFNPEYIYTMLIGDEDLSASDIDIDTTVKFFRDLAQREGMTRKSFIETYCEGEAPEVRETFLDIYDHINEYSDEQIRLYIKKALKVQKENSDLYLVVNHAVKGDFDEFITDKSNKYGIVNANTEQAFKNKGLDFDEWLKPNIDDVEFKIQNKPVKIKMWDRNPNEDLFIGNKTTCCTAIGTGCNAAATPAFLLSRSFNVVELYDDNNNAVGMSRVFMADIDGKPSIVMDNIELNQNFLKNLSEDEKLIVRDNFFKYINNLAQNVTGDKNSQVYFSSSYLKVDASDLEEDEKDIDFIGEVSQDNIYLNCLKGWFNVEDISEIPILLYKVPKN